MEVPLAQAYCPPVYVLKMFTPGAARSTESGPQLENDARTSIESVAATEIMLS